METRFEIRDAEFLLVKLDYPERLDEMGALRVLAWKEEQGISPDFFSHKAWLDEDDLRAHHWVIIHNKEIVAAARLSFHKEYSSVPHADLFDASLLDGFCKGPYASLNRLVVAPQYRGNGFSALLDEARINFAAEQGIKMIIAQPVESRIKPLEDLGFIYLGKIRPLFQMPERQIYFMIKELGKQD
ncbi:GNAT family N-acetyltransferase [Dyadobacter arcticus]|uniref:GNAT superfamily N-acetyltransferase n=1 Tax=Dyadobacter arcticus TaxID=1078754 RepID=A0ABX0UM10_9BACT|nr:GNAT family N-acetyltransferase [Dyadobacter arcticus]NIJ53947.1 GNAT superfamily N-acetyltransferase [Dyadobacter arcticus]